MKTPIYANLYPADPLPVSQKEEPCLQSRVGAVLGGGGAASRVEVGNLVENEGAKQAQITAGSRDDAGEDAERIHRGEADGVAEFAGQLGGINTSTLKLAGNEK